MAADLRYASASLFIDIPLGGGLAECLKFVPDEENSGYGWPGASPC